MHYLFLGVVALTLLSARMEAKDNLERSALYFLHLHPPDQTQAWCQVFYLLGHLIFPDPYLWAPLENEHHSSLIRP